MDDRRHETPCAASYKPFAWIMHTLRISDESIVSSHGLDTVMQLIFLRSMVELTGTLAVFAGIVLTVYATASNKNLPPSNPLRVFGIRILSLSNVPSKDWRHILVFISDLLISFWVLRKISKEPYLVTVRRDYRTSEHPSNYALIVQDIPVVLERNTDLQRF